MFGVNNNRNIKCDTINQFKYQFYLYPQVKRNISIFLLNLYNSTPIYIPNYANVDHNLILLLTLHSFILTALVCNVGFQQDLSVDDVAVHDN